MSDRYTHFLELECSDEELDQLLELCKALDIHGRVLEEVEDEA